MSEREMLETTRGDGALRIITWASPFFLDSFVFLHDDREAGTALTGVGCEMTVIAYDPAWSDHGERQHAAFVERVDQALLAAMRRAAGEPGSGTR